MMAFRSSAGISAVDMYRLRILKANSVYDRSFQLGFRELVGVSLTVRSIAFESDRLKMPHKHSCKKMFLDRREHTPSLSQSGLPPVRKDHRLQRVPSAQPSQTKA